jgi:hypothetical protein
MRLAAPVDLKKIAKGAAIHLGCFMPLQRMKKFLK